MAGLGRVTIDESGVIVAADAVFERTMDAPRDVLIGRNMLDFTAPADRERCMGLVAKVAEDGEPIVTTKRLIRPDGTHMWIVNELTLAESRHGAVRIAIAIEPGAPPSDWIEPAILLDIAKGSVAGRKMRGAAFSRMLFADHAWDILLAAYISEAEGGVLTAAELHDIVGIDLHNTSRWVRALHGEGLLEYEESGDVARTMTAVRLSNNGHRRFEGYLSDLHRLPAPRRATHP